MSQEGDGLFIDDVITQHLPTCFNLAAEKVIKDHLHSSVYFNNKYYFDKPTFNPDSASFMTFLLAAVLQIRIYKSHRTGKLSRV